jgi:hypothetical protein
MFKWVMCFACLMCLMLASTLSAQEDTPIDTGAKVVRLAAPNVPLDNNVTSWLETGAFAVAYPVGNDIKATPGPAPAPYPTAKVWESGIEQLGSSAVVCDGLTFVNGPNWVPNKQALVLWTIRIPRANWRTASEFNRDLTLQLWVDWNQNKAWEKSERMIVQSFNVRDLVPTTAPYVEVQYLTMFTIPNIEPPATVPVGKLYETRLWVRGAVTYDDSDASPAGQALFGEYEDWLTNYQTTKVATKVKG